MSDTYTNDIPVPTNPPASDVLNMQNNTKAVFEWVQVDHVGFNSDPNTGVHNQVNFASNQASPALIGTSVGEIWTKAGTAASTAQLFFKNTAASFQISVIRAWGNLSGSGMALPAQSYNVATIAHVNGSGTYTITLTAGAVASQSFGIIATCTNNGTTAFVATAFPLGPPNQLEIDTYNLSTGLKADPSALSFIVMQL